MTATRVQHRKALSANEKVRADSRRIRQEFLDIELTLSCTIATFPQAGDSQWLKEKCRSTALKGYTAARESMLRYGTHDGLEAKLDQLRAVLANGQNGNFRQIQSPEVAPLKAVAPVKNGHLTPREIEVLTCIAEGHSSKQVAGILGIAFKTVVCHRYHLMEKLAIHETAGLVRYAIRQGLIQA